MFRHKIAVEGNLNPEKMKFSLTNDLTHPNWWLGDTGSCSLLGLETLDSSLITGIEIEGTGVKIHEKAHNSCRITIDNPNSNNAIRNIYDVTLCYIISYRSIVPQRIKVIKKELHIAVDNTAPCIVDNYPYFVLPTEKIRINANHLITVMGTQNCPVRIRHWIITDSPNEDYTLIKIKNSDPNSQERYISVYFIPSQEGWYTMQVDWGSRILHHRKTGEEISQATIRFFVNP